MFTPGLQRQWGFPPKLTWVNPVVQPLLLCLLLFALRIEMHLVKSCTNVDAPVKWCWWALLNLSLHLGSVYSSVCSGVCILLQSQARIWNTHWEDGFEGLSDTTLKKLQLIVSLSVELPHCSQLYDTRYSVLYVCLLIWLVSVLSDDIAAHDFSLFFSIWRSLQ